MKKYKEVNSEHYEHGVDKPTQPKEGVLDKGLGCHDFKSEAMDIAYGQASMEGCKSDSGKITSQMKQYHWAD